MEKFKNWWLDFVNKLNAKGVPLPMVRDPKTGVSSVSLTLVFLSFNMVILGLIGKASGYLGGIDISQALNLFYACGALYWGRNVGAKPSAAQEQTPKQSPPADDPDAQ